MRLCLSGASIGAVDERVRRTGPLLASPSRMTAQEFLRVSTQLVNDMRVWVAEAAKDDALSVSDLAVLNASMKIVERVTLREAEVKPDTEN
jgi:hypothetical protein